MLGLVRLKGQVRVTSRVVRCSQLERVRRDEKQQVAAAFAKLSLCLSVCLA